MRVLVACDSFGGTLTATEAGEAIAAGWRETRPGDVIVVAPQSDGGPGFVDALAAHVPGAKIRRTRVTGPAGTPTDAAWLWAPGTRVAYIEAAEGCGLHLVPRAPGGRPTSGTALAATSRGVGELLGAAVEAGARTVVVGLGGSATSDGGRGLLAALGDTPVAALARLAGVRLIAATDVDNPLLGDEGAVAVFGRQKGADEATRRVLEERNRVWADELRAACGFDVAALAGAGAAGGIGATLLAAGAERVPGADVVAGATGLEDAIAAADVVITGEGRTDAQTLHGKVAVAVAGRAVSARRPVLLISGDIDLGDAALTDAGFSGRWAMTRLAGSAEASMGEPARWARITASLAAGEWGNGGNKPGPGTVGPSDA